MPRSLRRTAAPARWLFVVLGLAALGLAPTVAHAFLIAEERFLTSAVPTGPEYAIATIAGQNPTTPGFSGAWFTSFGASPTVNVTSLNYSDANFPAETGGRLLSPSSDSRVHRLLSAASNPFETTDAGTVYMSLLLQTGTNNGYRAFEMHNGGNDDAANRTLQIGLHNGGDFPLPNNYGFRVNNNGSLEFALGAENANANLFLVKFALSTTNNADTITVWQNPSLASLASDPAGGVVAAGFNFAADRLGAGHFTGTAIGLDELRIGTTLTDVFTDFLFCDINGNGVCNSSDVAIISQHMYLAGAFADGDVDGSGTIDFADYRLFKDHPARVVGFDPPGSGAGGTVPEPASMLMIIVGALLWCATARCRGWSKFFCRRKQSLIATRTLQYKPVDSCFFDKIFGNRSERRKRSWMVSTDLSRLSSLCCLMFNVWLRPKAALIPLLPPVPCFLGCAMVIALGAMLSCSPPVHAADQDLLNDALNFSGKTLDYRPYAATPSGFNNIIEMTHKPSDTRMFVVTEQGSIFTINEDASGNTSPALWFNASSALQTATGRTMNFSGSQQGLQSVAFHPNFERVGQPGYGKLYTTMLENRPANPNDPAHFYLGNSTYGNGGADGVLVEWTYNHATGQVDASSYRELFRSNMPNYDHPIKLAQFNPYSEPGDDDYGLLYVTHGDSNNQDSPNDDPQDRGDVLGKMLRINPLQSGANRYTIPATNPFFSSSNPSPTGTAILGEVYAYGLRNPHNYSFNQDDAGNLQILVADIGRSNMEEINLIVPGGNYGWPKREGTFIHLQGNTYPPNPSPNAGYIYGVSLLPGVEPEPDFIYPVAQYDHNGADVVLGADYTATSVAGGFVVRNGSDPTLNNQYVFHNFAFNHGDVYGTDFDAMLGANTSFETAEGPSVLTQAELFRFHLTLDHDNNPVTPPQTSDNLNTLLGTFRNDGRYGEGISGEMYVSTKAGNIYLVTNTVPDNRLTLTVDRGTGDMTITNSTGSNIEVQGVSVYSPSGSLDPAELQSVDTGWTFSPYNSAKDLSQASDAGSFELTGANSAALGNAYDAKLIAFGQPAGEDVQFVFETAGVGGRKFLGDVVYTGVSTVPNTIVLTVDLASGEAAIQNQTPFTQEVEGYTISSLDGSLNTAGWSSLDAQGIEGGDWIASPPLSTRLTELQEDGTTTFDDATTFALGEILQTSADQDLVFEFLLAGEGGLRQGLVTYILAGDYNGDNVVDSADYTVWRDHLDGNERLPNDMTPGSVTMEDYNIWKRNYGATLAGAGGSAAVPEPASLLVLGSALLTLGTVPRRQRP